MKDNIFSVDLSEDFEESVRVDRADKERDNRIDSIETYHLTEDSKDFLEEFILRLLARSDTMRSGYNYWLYGYYGSGKSHLLTVTDGLMDPSLFQDKGDSLWSLLTDGYDNLEDRWRELHSDYHVIPVSANLLKYQGQKERSFSEIVLRAAHQSEELTGVEGGLSPNMDIAYFEDWYRNTDTWDRRDEMVREVLEGVVSDPGGYDWSHVQKYGVLAETVLPKLFERETGSEAGLSDLTPSSMSPETAVERLEELRAEREESLDSDKSVRLVLLLDEVSLFIGTDFERLTELQILAESVKEQDGRIHLVVTAQDDVEELRPGLAAKGADVGILKDRFPHRHSLPSRHVGDIAEQRLLRKKEPGKVEDIFSDSAVEIDSIRYRSVKQDTEPSLSEARTEDVVSSYPFLPYQPPLFLEILYSLRRESRDPAKSIFSGTARAILALMHSLLVDWVEQDNETRLISLIDFYDKIETELTDILGEDVRVVEDVRDEYGDDSLEASITKAAFLLQYVEDYIPLTDENLAVATMDDLSGPHLTKKTNSVSESWDGLRKYIRKSDGEVTIIKRREREIYQKAEKKREDPDWRKAIESLDDGLWLEIVEDFGLPDIIDYKGTEESVRYTFAVDGVEMDTTVGEEDNIQAHIGVAGLSPESSVDTTTKKTLWVELDPDEVEGLDNLRDRLVEWWSLQSSVQDRRATDEIQADIRETADKVRSGLVEALGNATYHVEDSRDIQSIGEAVNEVIDARYPDEFHPRMLTVDQERLDELRDVDDDGLPAWARQIGVPTRGGEGTVQNNIRALVGRQLKEQGSLSVSSILDGMVERKSDEGFGEVYDEIRPALCGIIWGFCRIDEFLPVDEDGNTLDPDAVLDLDRLSVVRLRIGPGDRLGEILKKHGYKKSNETISKGISNLQEANESVLNRARNLSEDIDITREDIHSQEVLAMLENFESELKSIESKAHDRKRKLKGPSDDLDWDEIAEDTDEAENTLSEASSIWDERISYLYNFDGLLVAGERSFEWLDERGIPFDSLSETIEQEGDRWWTEDGWSSLAQEVNTSSVEDGMSEAWSDFLESSGLKELAEQASDDPWIAEPIELPSNVSEGFEGQYIRPVRRTLDWYNDVSEAVEVIASDPTSVDEADIVRATEILSQTEDFNRYVDEDIDEIRSKYERLKSLVGDRKPEDIRSINLIPEDRDRVKAEVESMESRDISFKQTEEGVIIE